MRRPLAVAALVALSCALRAGEGPAPVDPGGPEWRPLIAALAARPALEAPFTERRYFPFRRGPVVLRGVLRISRERGLSLQYTQPAASVVVADQSGILLRDADGRTRSLGAGSREAGSLSSLLPILRFDVPALSPRFQIRGLRTGDGWLLEFAPRDPALSGSLGDITVSGEGAEVRRLEFRRSAAQRIEIEVGAARIVPAFGPDDLRRFFR